MKDGYTITEVLIVIAILGLVSAVSIPVYGNFINLNYLESEKDQILQHIRYAQSRAKSGLYGDNYGVHFNTSTYILYSGDSFSQRNQTRDELFEVSDNLQLTNLDDINFDIKTGVPSDTGTLILVNKNSQATSSISINNKGLIE